MTNALSPVRNAIVTVQNGRPVCNSRDVAAIFGKRHDNVLRAMGAMECSREFTALNFEVSEYTDATGRKLRSMNMTKDGFVFLVMGFTGTDAARFKEAYITRFNEMEEALRAQVSTSSLTFEGASVVAFFKGAQRLRVVITRGGPLFVGVDLVRMVYARAEAGTTAAPAYLKDIPPEQKVTIARRDVPELFRDIPSQLLTLVSWEGAARLTRPATKGGRGGEAQRKRKASTLSFLNKDVRPNLQLPITAPTMVPVPDDAVGMRKRAYALLDAAEALDAVETAQHRVAAALAKIAA
jgi:Rha family phage regulatory protein